MTTVKDKSRITSNLVPFGFYFGNPAYLRISMATLVAAMLFVASCAKKDAVAGLSELPRGSAAKLQTLTNPRLLATKIQQIDPGPAGQSNALCAKDWTVTFFAAQVTMEITVCTHAEDRTTLDSAFFPPSSNSSTFRLTDLTALDQLKNGELLQPPLVCKVNNGPWPAVIRVDRGCIGVCKPVNFMTVQGVPNEVAFAWYGGFQDHPAGFEFVGNPTVTDQINLGECNSGPVSAPLRP